MSTSSDNQNHSQETMRSGMRSRMRCSAPAGLRNRFSRAQRSNLLQMPRPYVSMKEISDAFIKALVGDIVHDQEIDVVITDEAMMELIEATEKYAQKLFNDCQAVAEHDDTIEELGIFDQDLLFVLNFRKKHGMR